MKKIMHLSLVLAAAGLVACGKAPSKKFLNQGAGQNGSDDSSANGDGDQVAGEGAMLTCKLSDGKQYKGFGNTNLVAGRDVEIAKEGDRFRVKPYSVLAGEFTRVMNNVPPSLAANAATFTAAPDRWYVDTTASAVTLFTSFRVSYAAALTYAASDPKFAAAPTEETATAMCTSFSRQAWNRLPTQGEIASCKKVALVDSAAETDPKARWAYAMASVLTATGFIAY